MTVKKELLKYFLIVLILGLASAAFGYGTQKMQTRIAEAKKSEQSSKNKDKKKEQIALQETPSSGSFAYDADQGIQPDPGNQGASQSAPTSINSSRYPIHRNITTTFFWAGEEAGKDNKNISNLPSAWDEQWVKHFGGVDDPDKRKGVFPAKFTPKENPFYFALPYNDFDSQGKRKKEVSNLIPWAKEKNWGKLESVCKNRWIKIMKNGKAAYAQWQDVGPFKENDAVYVFGTALPKSKTNKNAGLDISPAVKDYLGLTDVDKADWQFVEEKDVPAGPWKKIITTSQIFWR